MQLATLNHAQNCPCPLSDSAAGQHHMAAGNLEVYGMMPPRVLPRCQGTTLVKGTLLQCPQVDPCGTAPALSLKGISLLSSHKGSAGSVSSSPSLADICTQAAPPFPASPSARGLLPAPSLICPHRWYQKQGAPPLQFKRNPSISTRIPDLGSPYCFYPLCITKPSCSLGLLLLTVSLLPPLPRGGLH